MEILTPSLISALALGAFCCPALARPVDYLLNGGTITTIPTFDLTAVPDWWLSGGFAAHPAGTAATLALLFLISLLFFSMEQAKGVRRGRRRPWQRPHQDGNRARQGLRHMGRQSEPQSARLRIRLHQGQVPIRA